MSTWSRPYLFLVGADDALIRLADLADAPDDAKVVVRWRVPGRAHPRRRTFAPADRPAATALVQALTVAHADPQRWQPDDDGTPVPAPEPAPTPATAPAPTTRPSPVQPIVLGSRLVASPANPVLRAVGDGQLALGSTVSEVIDRIIDKRQPGWGAHQDTNIRNAFEFVRQVLVYAEPNEDDGPEIAAWKRARLDLDGVEEGASLHVALILTPDLEDALAARRTTDRRTDLLNLQARVRWEKQWARYTDALAARAAGTRRGGRMPAEPPTTLELRSPKPISAATEKLFMQLVRAVLDYAERNGLLAGPNPWAAFAADGSSRRRPRPLKVHQRHVPTMGAVVQIADAVARLGRTDPRTGRPVGDRFRAAVLVGAAGLARPSEVWGLLPEAYVPGPNPYLVISRSAGPANAASTEDGSSWEVRDGLKGRDPGEERRVDLPQEVADAIEAHLAAGYASEEYLFTGPEGGPVRWSAYTDTYWKPAVAAVLGQSREPLLRDMPFRWLRKAGITWRLRAGMDPTTVAELAGHDPAVLWAHYAGVIRHSTGHSPHARRQWNGVEAAWAWAVTETAHSNGGTHG